MKKLGMMVVAVGGIAAFTGALLAAGGGPARVRASARSLPPSISVPANLPALPKGPMKVTKGHGTEAISVLQFDDNTCESGLGAGVQVSSLVEFLPAPPCTNAGPLQILNVTARMNSNSAQDFVFHNPGATPQMANAATVTQPLSAPIPPAGACPATGGLVQRVLAPPVSFAPGNSTNFFAGIRNTGFAARDTTAPNNNRIWLNCAGCGMTQYSPADLNAIGLGGNWLIRVTVEDVGCTPVELQHLEVSD